MARTRKQRNASPPFAESGASPSATSGPLRGEVELQLSESSLVVGTSPPTHPSGGPHGFWAGLIATMPKLRTAIQLTGFIVLVAGFLAYRSVPQEHVPGVIAAGGIGILLLIFGQFFRLVDRRQSLQDSRLITTMFLIFSFFVLGLFLISVYFLGSTTNHSKTVVVPRNEFDNLNKQVIETAKSRSEYRSLIGMTHEANRTELNDHLARSSAEWERRKIELANASVLNEELLDHLKKDLAPLEHTIVNLPKDIAKLGQTEVNLENATDKGNLTTSAVIRQTYNQQLSILQRNYQNINKLDLRMLPSITLTPIRNYKNTKPLDFRPIPSTTINPPYPYKKSSASFDRTPHKEFSHFPLVPRR
jgi:hypothetical protein